ncbi:TIGR02444 family protein [Vibrio splendidus]|uniref:TIGR02444 family protein n=1 Tax=Vibrio TaxID=662 RepID=UPI000D333FA4|nr:MULTISPECIES: TIGR02444 family protein [Vibrio]MBB1463882.1 TIGR02444 family protein [Vibrio sp. SG41-7]PTP56785.1 TIGR02444 family protein [Vibrio splendidus]PTQ08645.1 TIGR02444 family protein [Vibrio splendidus]
MSPEHAPISLTLERLWQFSLQYYSVRGVKDACLALQNQFHGNVNLLLLLKWLDEQQLSFAEEDWHKVQQCLSRSETLLHSYRELRKHLKPQVVDSLYREALQFELQLEKQQQSDLVDCINSLQLTANQQSPLAFQYCRLLGAENLYDAFSEPAPQP